MRQMIGTMLAGLTLLGMLAVPASADESTLAELEAAVAAAQEAVDTIRDEIADLEGELVLAEEALRQASADVAVQQEIVDSLRDDLAAAQGALATAEALRAQLQAAYDACTTGACRNEYAHPVHGGPLTDAREDVLTKEAEVEAIEDELEGAVEELERLEGVEEAAAGEVARIEAEIEAKESELEAAEAALRAAEEALEAYEPPALDQISPGPGCKGIANAAAQVEGKGKASDKAKASLTKVADKLHCDAA